MRRRVIQLSAPVFAEVVLQTLTQVVDMAMVGRLGASAIAAVGLSMQPLFLGQGVFMGLSVGTTALVARFTGAQDRRMAARTNHQSFLVSMILAIGMSAGVYAYARDIVGLMGAEPDVIALGTSYLRRLAPGFGALLGTMTVGGALRGAGDTTTPMKINVLVNFVNVVGNYALIFGHLGCPALGVEGAALATTASRIVGGALFVWASWRPGSPVAPTRRQRLEEYLKVDVALVGRVLRVGVPAILERLVISSGMLVYIREVAGLGTVVYAAHNVANNAESLSFMPGLAFATAATALVGQGLGAGKPDAAERSAQEALRLGLTVMGAMALVFLAAPQYLMMIFTSDPEIIRLGSMALRVISFAQIPMGVAFIYSGALRGAGDTRSVLYVTVFAVWVVRLSATYILVSVGGLGLVGAWLAMVADWLVRGVYVWRKFRSGRWKPLQV
ncbi:MAG: MATE family efflux transporter [Firmicutes bacterium]|jgi:putative MATE family efflux protein|nr:MATE family efflux transporter [Bacillota bacterium]